MATQYNVNLIGSLTNTNGVLSGFSANSNYATFSGDTFNDTDAEIVFKVNFNRVTGDEQMCYAFYDSTKTYSLCVIGLSGGKFYFEITNGTASLGDISGTTTVAINTDYYIKAVRNNTTYTLYSSTNGTNWTTEGTLSNITFPSYTSATNYIGGYVYNDNGLAIDQILDGTVDLNESYIKVGGQYVWRGVTNITTIQLRRDIATNWTSVNPILLEGEVGIETDTRKQKFGDGSTAWNSLAYSNGDNKQDALVSGTNIKTINSTSLLGSGNIDTSQIFFAQYGTTTTTQITQALGDGKAIFCIKSVSSADYIYYYSGTATIGGLSAFTFSRTYQNTSEVVYILSSTNQWNTITKTLANDDLSNVSSIDSGSAVQTALDGKADTTLSNVSSIDANSAVQTALNGKADTDLSNLSSNGKKVIDGQWSNTGSGNIVNGSNITWTSGHDYDLSTYLPNDGKIYEVIFTASWQGSTAGANHELRASTDVITSAWSWLGRASGTAPTAGTCILPVGSGRYVKLTTASSGKACNSVYFSALAYRRLGTNS